MTEPDLAALRRVAQNARDVLDAHLNCLDRGGDPEELPNLNDAFADFTNAVDTKTVLALVDRIEAFEVVLGSLFGGMEITEEQLQQSLQCSERISALLERRVVED